MEVQVLSSACDEKAASAAFVHSRRAMHMYSDLAPWFHLLTHPSDYADEAAFVTRVVDDVGDGDARTLLELGSGGGNNASHLKARFECTLTDLSPEMLALSRTLNPECEHLEGDMRTLRLGRTFDVVFIHDAISYLTTEDDLARGDRDGRGPRAAGRRRDPRRPTRRREIFEPATDHGGHDGDDGRSLRYLEWTHAPEPATSTYVVDYVDRRCASPASELRVVHDRHTLGLFPEATWKRLIAEAGLELVDTTVENPYELEQPRSSRAAARRLTSSGRISTLLWRTYVRPTTTGEPDADDTTTGDLAVPRRVRGRARLSADRSGDRRRRRSRLPVDRPRAPREPRARRPAAPRPDEATRDRARRATPRGRAATRATSTSRRCRSSAGSPPAARCSPRRRSRTRSPFPSRSAATRTSSFA